MITIFHSEIRVSSMKVGTITVGSAERVPRGSVPSFLSFGIFT